MTMEYQDPISFKVTCGWFKDSKFSRAEFDIDMLKELPDRRLEPEDSEYDPFKGGGRSTVTGY